VALVTRSPENLQRMASIGLERSREFSWKTHVEQVLELCHALMNSRLRPRSRSVTGGP
jgi:hypothetical protein